MKEQLNYIHIGVDVSKGKLDVFHPNWKSARTFENTPAGIRKLFSALMREGEPCHVVVEATGGYEKNLARGCWEAGIPVSVVNAGRVREFAKSAGQLAKTDPLDAKVIGEFGACHKPRATPPPNPAQEELQGLVRRRESLVALRSREKNQLEKTPCPSIAKDIRSLIRVLDGRVAKFDKLIAALISNDEDLRSKCRRLEEVVGVGRVLSGAVLAEMPELGTIGDRQVSALAGLAPFAKDSGKRNGKRAIQGGRGRLRRALHMPTLCAVHHNPVLSEFYLRLMAGGKPHHVALTAAMRKLLVLLNRMLADPDFRLSS